MQFQFISSIHQEILLLLFHKAYPGFCAPVREYFQLHSDLEVQGWGSTGSWRGRGRWYRSNHLDGQVFGKESF